MNSNIRILVTILFFFTVSVNIGQYKAGKIVYERKTNLEKRFGEGSRKWLDEKSRIKIEFFELVFNDTCSLWNVQATGVPDPMSWGTSRNLVYRNTKKTTYYSIRDIWGDMIHVEDTLPKRTWKMTTSRRTIAGYDCKKALWEVNDSTTIYAWYAEEIIPSIGPERFYGLPGAILGLASEDGGVVYFAKTIQFYGPKREEFDFKRSKKTQTLESTREQIELVMSRNKYWKSDISHYFLW
jgi:GLPGLI family protein